MAPNSSNWKLKYRPWFLPLPHIQPNHVRPVFLLSPFLHLLYHPPSPRHLNGFLMDLLASWAPSTRFASQHPQWSFSRPIWTHHPEVWNAPVPSSIIWVNPEDPLQFTISTHHQGTAQTTVLVARPVPFSPVEIFRSPNFGILKYHLLSLLPCNYNY